MLHNVYLYGDLGKKYGTEHRFDISNAPQAARALAANYKEFFNDFKDGFYKIVVGKTKDDGIVLDKDTLDFKIGKDKSVHIIPLAIGSKNRYQRGAVKGISGIVLAGAGFFLGQGWLVNIGIAATLSGVSVMLAPSPKINNYGDRESPDKRSSFLFNGPVNRVAEGSTIPLVYGRVRTGSIVISTGISTEQIAYVDDGDFVDPYKLLELLAGK